MLGFWVCLGVENGRDLMTGTGLVSEEEEEEVAAGFRGGRRRGMLGILSGFLSSLSWMTKGLGRRRRPEAFKQRRKLLGALWIFEIPPAPNTAAEVERRPARRQAVNAFPEDPLSVERGEAKL